MTKGEMAKLLTLIFVAFPHFEVTDERVKLWHELLGDLDYRVVENAVRECLLSATFPPTIAEVRKAAVAAVSPPRIPAAEAWGEVVRAIHRHGRYQEREALQSMTPLTARVVSYIGWESICDAEEDGVIRGQFLKMFAEVDDRDAKQALLPPQLRERREKAVPLSEAFGGVRRLADRNLLQ